MVEAGISYRVCIFTPSQVERHYAQLHALFTDALRYGLQDCTTERIFELIRSGHYTCWVILHKVEGSMYGAFVTSLVRYQLRRTCKVVLIAGVRMPEWVSVVVQQVEDYAKIHCCDGVEFEGRPGWGKLLKPYGVNEVYRTFTKDLMRC